MKRSFFSGDALDYEARRFINKYTHLVDHNPAF